MNRETRLLLKARDSAFASGDTQAYSTARANLKRGIKRAKHEHKLRIEEHFANSDSRRMWQGIQAITNYKSTKSSPLSSDTSFPDELNSFYARFDRENKETATRADLPANHQPLILSTTDVQAVLCRTNARKAAGPNGISGRVLRACAVQLSGVLTDIFNLSLAQATVPTCFKTTTIVPVPKHPTAVRLNDFRPCGTHFNHNEVLRDAGPGPCEIHHPTNPRPVPVCFPGEQEYRGCHRHSPSFHHHPPGYCKHLC